MKKLAFLAVTAAVIIVPAGAKADWVKKETRTVRHHPVMTERTVVRDSNDFAVRIDKTDNADGILEKAKMHPVIFPLANSNDSVEINGGAVYLINGNGGRYLAPTGSYTAENGITFVVESGLVMRAEEPDQIVYIDADLRDTDRDGYANTVEVNTRTRRSSY